MNRNSSAVVFYTMEDHLKGFLETCSHPEDPLISALVTHLKLFIIVMQNIKTGVEKIVMNFWTRYADPSLQSEPFRD